MSEANGASCVAAGGPGARLRVPGGVQGRSPGGGRGGEAPRSPQVSTPKKPLKAL